MFGALQFKWSIVVLYWGEVGHLNTATLRKTIMLTRVMWNVSLMACWLCCKKDEVKVWLIVAVSIYSAAAGDYIQTKICNAWIVRKKRFNCNWKAIYLPTCHRCYASPFLFLPSSHSAALRSCKMQMWTLQAHQLWCLVFLGWLRRNKRTISCALVSLGVPICGFSGWLTRMLWCLYSQVTERWSC